MKLRLSYLATAIVVVALSVSVASAQKEGLKVFISVDMEGIAGIVNSDQVTMGGNDYNMARKWMTEEANAAILGALDAGATEIVVNDSHSTMRNLIAGDINPAARLITGSPKTLGMMQGIDETFDAVIFIGYHARAGSADGVLDHTYSGAAVHALRVNGKEIGETELNALIAGHFNVPVVMVAGDATLCAQVKQSLGSEVVTTETKEAIGRYAAKTLVPSEAQKQIRTNTATALKKPGNFKPYKMDAPFVVEIDFLYSNQAENAALVPGVERVSARTVRYTQPDFISAFRMFRALVTLANA